MWRTPPLILPFESLQRTMANTREPPKCSIGKKSGGGGGGSVGLGVRSMNAEGEVKAGKCCHVFTHVFQPPVLRLYELLH